MNKGLLICDFGSQYTLLIARRLRELGVYSEIIDGPTQQAPVGFSFDGMILSGGPNSLAVDGGKTLPEWIHHVEKPILGICYGMQLLVQAFGGVVREGKQREFGRTQIIQKPKREGLIQILEGTSPEQIVWMSHSDDVERLPEEFVVLGESSDGVCAAIAHRERPICGLQFHPEVNETQFGTEILKNFALKHCGSEDSWDAGCLMSTLCEQVQYEIGTGKVLLAVSGGVDSSVAALLLHKALKPEQVDCVLVDHGLMRKNEVNEVQENFKKMGVELVVLREEECFLESLTGVTDPEEKRKIIGRLFVECFESYAKSKPFTHLGQGTLYPDVIESAGHGAGSKVIKSHHNVGGLPKRLKLKLLEPFRFLFKDEVRILGEALGLATCFIQRHPFPGPGLGIRIPGEITREKIHLLREADAIFISSLKEHELYQDVWQAATVLLPVKSVGVMGDNRTYQWTCVLRAVVAKDAMTAEVAPLPLSFLSLVSNAIVSQVDGINRVLYDVTSKPPATIEWE